MKKNIEYFKNRESEKLSYSFEINARKNGNHVVIVGAVHGDEPSGVEAMVNIHKKLLNKKNYLKSGKVTFILGNPKAYKENTRYIDKDLNRSFEDPDLNTIEGNRACEIINFFKNEKTIVSLIDLHSVSRGDFQIVAYNARNNNNFKIAKLISNIILHFSYHSKHLKGLLIEKSEELNISSIAIECGSHKSKKSICVAEDHIENFLSYYDIINYKPFLEENKLIKQYETIKPIIPKKDFEFLIKNITTGTRLDKGEKFAKDSEGYHFSNCRCYLMMPSKNIRDTDCDAGFLCKINLLGANIE